MPELCSCICIKGVTLTEIHDNIVNTLGEDFPSYSTIKTRVVNSKRGKKSPKDDPMMESPKQITINNKLEPIQKQSHK